MISRIIVYSGLLVLIILTAYVRMTRPPAFSGEQEVSAPDISQQTQTSTLPEGRENPAAALHIAEPPLLLEMQPPQSAAEKEKRERYEKARQFFRDADYASAVRILKELPDEQPGVLTLIGLSRFKLADYANAVVSLERAVALNPGDATARKVLAFAYYKMDDLPQALVHGEAALSVGNDQDLQTLVARLKREKKTQADFVGESSDHFKILYEGYRHGGVARDILSLLEDAYRSIGRELNHFPDDTVTVILYTQRDFTDTVQAPAWSAGIYDGKIRLPVRGMTSGSPVLKKILFHEYAHAAVHSLTRNCPRWLNEGLAEYFSTTYPRRIGQSIPLKDLDQAFRSPGTVPTAYWESWSAVSYLIERHGIYRVKDVLVALGSGTDPDEAFRSSFGVTRQDFLSEWGKD